MADAAESINSTGTFNLPKLQEVPIQSEPLTVLVVDDDPAFRYLAGCALEDDRTNDYNIVEARDCASALQTFNPDTIDCALIDYNLPDGDGCRLMHQIHEAFPSWFGPILIVTSGGNEKIAVEVMRAGAADYIPKQAISTSAVQRALMNALEKAKLKRAVFERNEKLETANSKLEVQNNEISRFYHRVSHEIKTPLTAARMFMSMLYEELAGPLNDEQKSVLLQAIESCDELTKHFNDLVECTRLDADKMTLNRQVESLELCIQRAIASVQEAARSRNVALNWSVCNNLLPFPMDGGRVVQVIANLLGNALKFTDEGGSIELTAEVSAGKPGFVEIRVADTGDGIAAEHLGRIFDRLYQVGEVGDARMGAGLGLGLTIASELVALHGGSIDVESEPGVGSTFTVFLPLNPDDFETKESSPS